LQPNLSIDVAELLLMLLKKHYAVDFPKVITSASIEPAFLHLLCLRYAFEKPEDPVTLLIEIENKAFEEFLQDIIPVISNESSIRRNLRLATLGICPITLDSFLSPKDAFFFVPFTEKFDNSNQNCQHLLWENELAFLSKNPEKQPLPIQTWGIKQSIFSTFIQRVITPDGKLNRIDSLKYDNDKLTMMHQLQILGEHINNLRILTLDNSITTDEKNLREKLVSVIGGFFHKHGLLASDYRKKLEEFQVFYSMRSYPFNDAGFEDELLWAREWRNTYGHLIDRKGKKIVELSNLLPPNLRDLIEPISELLPCVKLRRN